MRIAKIVWVSCCLVALAFYIWRRSISDADMVTIYAMMALGFPAAWLSTMLLGWFFLSLAQHGYSQSALEQTLLLWAVCFVVGYLQWFVALPALIRNLRARQR